MSFWMRMAFFCAHVIEFVLIIALFKDYHFVDPALYEAVKDQKSLDAMHVASELGRFDMVSAYLGVFSIFIALAAIFAFVEVRTRAEKAANEAATAIVNEKVKALFEEAMKARPQGVPSVVDLSPADEAKALGASEEIK
jgi:hypothetical protein